MFLTTVIDRAAQNVHAKSLFALKCLEGSPLHRGQGNKPTLMSSSKLPFSKIIWAVLQEYLSLAQVTK